MFKTQTDGYICRQGEKSHRYLMANKGEFRGDESKPKGKDKQETEREVTTLNVAMNRITKHKNMYLSKVMLLETEL